MTEEPAGAPAPPRTRDAGRTRTAIADAARALFAEHGYEATPVRTVAAAAGITPGLVTRYFGSKDGLFLAVSDVGLRVSAVLDGPHEGIGARMAASMVSRWRQEGAGDPVLILVRAAGSRPEAAHVLRDFLERETTGPLVTRLRAEGVPEAEARDRASAVDAFVMGAVMSRRVVDPVGPDGDEALAAWIGSSVQALLDHARS